MLFQIVISLIDLLRPADTVLGILPHLRIRVELPHKMPVFFLDRGLVILRGDPQSAPCLL